MRENELKQALDRIKDNSIIRQEIRSRDIKDEKPPLPSPAKEVWQMDSKAQNKMADDRGGGRYTIHVKKSNKNLDAEFKQLEQRPRQGTVLTKVEECAEGQEKKPFGGMMMFGSRSKISDVKVQKIKSGLRNLI